MWYQALRPALFALDPERAHKLVLQALRTVGQRGLRVPVGVPVELMGLRFPNRVGLAAGFDKNGAAVDGLGSLGFGFIEVGTVTPRAQPGRARPRLFRLPAEGALINRLGFPNDGAAEVAARLRHRRYRGIVGVNIGKNAATPVARAIDDYVACMRMVQQDADYVTVNVSSPNTAGLRTLQEREHLEPLLTALLQERAKHSRSREHHLPLLVKIAPDLKAAEVRVIASLLVDLRLDGVIATNTTVSRHGISGAASNQAGGISGLPLHPLALHTIKGLRAALGPAFPIIGAGGIDSPKAAIAMRDAGADLVQIYTGLIYKGPSLISKCIRALG
jgi:dihydroorotate dehydrogenase